MHKLEFSWCRSWRYGISTWDHVSPNDWMTKRNRKPIPAAEQSVGSIEDSPEFAHGDEITPESTAPTEHGGPSGKDPTRYGDWEKNGRCIDF